MHSTLISFYDPLGFPSLFILRGRKILQDLSQEGLQWDETVSKMYQRKRECWKNYLIGLEKIEMKRKDALSLEVFCCTGSPELGWLVSKIMIIKFLCFRASTS